jgi:hypothetical protein
VGKRRDEGRGEKRREVRGGEEEKRNKLLVRKRTERERERERER